MVAPYHSDEDTDTRWHDQENCPGGQRIEPQNLRSGEGGRPYCRICADLSRKRGEWP